MTVTVRLTALLVVVAVAVTSSLRLVTAPLSRLVDAWVGPDLLRFEVALEGGCAVLLAGCTCWLLAVTVAAAAATVLRTRGHRRLAARLDGHCPVLLRGLVVAAVGVTVTTGAACDATADHPGRAATSPSVLDGLPVPDRALGAGPLSTPTRARTAALRVVVRPGDSLWAIASRLLPPSASPAATAAAVRRLYATNADRVGPDPDLIAPGTPLVLPDLSTPRKDDL